VLNEEAIWDKVMTSALNMRGVKVKREEFLHACLKSYYPEELLEMVIKDGAASPLTEDIIEKAANSCINAHTAEVSTISTIAGLPGGLAMAAAIPGDIIQYYWHVLVLCQKLAYLYGFPDLRDEEGNLSLQAKNMLTLFVGVMMGSAAAREGFSYFAKEFASQVVQNIPQDLLLRKEAFPIIKQVAKTIGLKLDRGIFSKSMSKVMPLVGGVISGVLTYASFRPGAKRLQKVLREEMHLLGIVQSANQLTEKSDNTKNAQDNQELDILIIKALINMAKIDSKLALKEQKKIKGLINHSSIDYQTKTQLIIQLCDKEPIELNFSSFKGNVSYSMALIDKLIQVMRIDGVINPKEKEYLMSIVKDLDLDSNKISELLEESTGAATHRLIK
jgi:uncharacterized membrane protein YebE (DUF533 family)